MARFIGFGKIGRKPELKTKGKSPYCLLAIAIQPEKSDPIWLRVTMWGTKGKVMAGEAKVGYIVYVDGLITASEYNGQKFFNLKPDIIQIISKEPQAICTVPGDLSAKERDQLVNEERVSSEELHTVF